MTLNDPVAGSASSLPDLLLVEDNALHARLVSTMLDDIWPHGVPLRHVKRLEGALEAVQTSPPDCVLLDLVLPDASNLEAVEALVAAAPGLPIVVLSSHHDEEMAVKAIRAGAQDFLVKGTATADSLGRAIRFAVQRGGAEARAPRRDDEVTLQPGHAVLDAEGRMLYAGPEVADLLGRSLENVIGRPRRVGPRPRSGPVGGRGRGGERAAGALPAPVGCRHPGADRVDHAAGRRRRAGGLPRQPLPDLGGGDGFLRRLCRRQRVERRLSGRRTGRRRPVHSAAMRRVRG